jgi:hypothetical protein
MVGAGAGQNKRAGSGVSASGLHHGFLDERKLNHEPCGGSHEGSLKIALSRRPGGNRYDVAGDSTRTLPTRDPIAGTS